MRIRNKTVPTNASGNERKRSPPELGVRRRMNLKTETKRFKEWAGPIPVYERSGEWECDYEHWDDIYRAVDEWIENPDWGDEIVESLLYLIARDNEGEVAKEKIAEKPELALKLAKRSIESNESGSKWQLAKAIGSLENNEVNDSLWNLYFDRDYYVQRVCMMESAKRGSSHTREMIERSWSTDEEYQMICVLWSLYWLKASDLKEFLDKAKKSEFEHLKKNAEEISNQALQATSASARRLS